MEFVEEGVGFAFMEHRDGRILSVRELDIYSMENKHTLELLGVQSSDVLMQLK